MSDDERDSPVEIIAALRDLVQSPGWKLLIAQADVEWGPRGYGQQMQHALSSIPVGPDRPYEIARIAEQVDAVASAVQKILAWPEEQMRMLSGATDKPRRAFAGLRRMGR